MAQSTTVNIQGIHGSIDRYCGQNVEDWDLYTEIMDQYFISNNITDDDKKRAVFLTCVGPDTYKLIRNILAPVKPDTKTFTELCKVVKDHLDPKPSKIVGRYKFYSRSRLEGESIADFVAALRELSQSCKFHENIIDDMLRDRLVCGVSDERIQRRLLGEDDTLTFEKAFSIAQGMEAAARNTAALHVSHDVKTSPINVVDRNSSRPPGKCYGCGGLHFRSACPFKDSSCHFCKQKGHISRVCRAKQQQANAMPLSQQRQSYRSRVGIGGNSRNTHVVLDDVEDEGVEKEDPEE
jgi:hypothetical protein